MLAVLASFLSTGTAAPVVRIESQPAGAMVFVDGRYRGLTPTTVTGVAEGDHLLRLTMRGHQPWVRPIRVPLPKGTVTAALTPIPKGSLRVESAPVAGEVLLDGRALGETPLSLELAAATYRVRVRAKGYHAAEELVNVKPGAEQVCRVELRSGAETFLLSQWEAEPLRGAVAYEIAHLYVMDGRYDQALEALERGLRAALDPRAPTGEAHRLIGEIGKIHSGQFRFGTAEERAALQPRVLAMVEKVHQDQPRNICAAEQLGRLYTASKRPEDALQLYRKAAHTMRSSRAKGYLTNFAVGAIQTRARQQINVANAKRQAYLKLARQAKAGGAKAPTAEAVEQAKAEMEGLFREALKTLRIAVTEFPKAEGTLSCLTQIANIHNSYLGDKEQYLATLREIIKRFPDADACPSYRQQIAQHYSAEKGHEREIAEYRLYLRDYADRDDCPSIRERIGKYLEEGGDLAGAVKEYAALVTHHPDWDGNARILARLASLCREAGKPAQAEKWLGTLLKEYPHSAEAARCETDPARKKAREEATAAYASVRTEFGKLSQLKNAYKAAAAKAESLKEAGEARAEEAGRAADTAKQVLGSAGEAVVLRCEKLAEDFPWTGQARSSMSLAIQVYSTWLEDQERVIAALRRYVELFPDDDQCPHYQLQISSTYQKLGNSEQAIAAAKKFVADYPRDDRALSTQWQVASLCASLQGREGRDRRLAELERLVELFPRSSYATRALYTIAIAYYYQSYPGDRERAIATFARFTRDYPHSSYATRSERYRARLDDGAQMVESASK